LLAHYLPSGLLGLGLTAAARRRQMEALAERMEKVSPGDTPLIIAGDFNDWRNRADNLIAGRLGMVEVFGGLDGQPARSFPATLPVFRLDRIYVRGFTIEHSEVHFGRPWSKISDHAALSAHIAVE
jgi:endonuclease/exonuclease/phosphatase family metal-dependent hydrolase